MEKRLFVAVALSVVIMVTWQSLFMRRQPVVSHSISEISGTSEQGAAHEKLPAAAVRGSDTGASWETKEHTFEGLRVNFIPGKAAIKDITLTDYQGQIFPLNEGFFLGIPDLMFVQDTTTPHEVSFVHTDKVKRIVQSYSYDPLKRTLAISVKIQNMSSQPIQYEPGLSLALIDLSTSDPQSRYQEIVVATREKTIRVTPRKYGDYKDIKFAAVRDQYFCAILQPADPGYVTYIKSRGKHQTEVGVRASSIIVPGDGQIVNLFAVYFGPQDVTALNNVNPAWASIVHYGTFDIISHLILQLLGLFNKLVHNWGVAIILLSIVVYFGLFPLTIKQMKAMKAMQDVQPQIEALRITYKNNPQRMNKEIMELYKHHKVNPLGGCLPLVLQTPIFFALYQALSRSVSLRGAHFLWIKDLSSTDKLFTLPVTLPLVGNEFNILPVLMAVGMFIQQKISLAKSGGAAAEQQKMMVYIFPFMFCFIFYKMPSGLVMYWLVNSVLMLLSQIRVNKSP